MDDDPSIRDLVGELLASEGYNVEYAEDGQQALDHLRASSDRLVTLLDIMMPTLDGIEVLKRVAAEDGLADRHGFVIMTASSVYESDELTRLIHQFNAPVLKKPFSIEGLLAAADSVAERLRD